MTDTRIRNAKPRAQSYKLSDGGGMYLLVTSKGASYWRLDYRFAGKRRTLALGVYPNVSLSNARSRREDARALLAKDIDPGVAKKTTKRIAKLASETIWRSPLTDPQGLETRRDRNPSRAAHSSSTRTLSLLLSI